MLMILILGLLQVLGASSVAEPFQLVVSEDDPHYCLTVARSGLSDGFGVVMALIAQGNDDQLWRRDYSMGRFVDPSGGLGYALVNKGTGLFLQHGILPGEVNLVGFDEIGEPDSSLLWGSSQTWFRDGSHHIWTIANIFLCLDATKSNTKDDNVATNWWADTDKQLWRFV